MKRLKDMLVAADTRPDNHPIVDEAVDITTYHGEVAQNCGRLYPRFLELCFEPFG